MPAHRRSISVPPLSKFPSTFDHPSLNSSQPATPIYGRHTGLEGYVPEGFLHTPQTGERTQKRTHSEELVQGLEKVQMGTKVISQASSLEIVSPPSPSNPRPVLSPFPAFTLDPSLSLTPPPTAKAFPSIAAYSASVSSPCPLPASSPQFQLYDPNPSNPQALPLPTPPQEGEYIFPDSSGRASLIHSHPPFPRAPAQVQVDLHLHLATQQGALVASSSSQESYQQSHSWLPPSPRLEPMRDLYPSPPSGRLSAFSPSPLNPSSPTFELEGPLFGGWTPVQSGNGGGGLHAQLQHHGIVGGGRTRGRGSTNRNSANSPSPFRGNGARAKERELEKAKERIRELEREVAMLRQAFIMSTGQQESLTPS